MRWLISPGSGDQLGAPPLLALLAARAVAASSIVSSGSASGSVIAVLGDDALGERHVLG
jgi:hypothetical protein